MKKLFYTTLCMLTPVLSFCQFNSSIDLAGGLDYSYRHLSTSETDEIYRTIFEIRQQEQAKTGVRFGFNYNKRLAKNLVFKTGLRYASKGYKSEKKGGLRYESEYATGVYVLDPSLVHEYQYVYNYWFLELPLAVRFELSKKKFSPYIETGLSPSLYLTNNVTRKTNVGSQTMFNGTAEKDFNKIHLAGFLAVGANYTIKDKLQFFAQPNFTYHLTQLRNSSIHEYLYNFGIEIGVRRKLK